MKEPDALAPWNTLTPRRGERALVRCAGVADARGEGPDAGAEVLLERDERGVVRVLAVGRPGSLGDPDARRVDLPGVVLLPALANAHTHLDLTHIGPRRYDPTDGFATWVGMVLRERARDESDIRSSTRLGIEKSLGGGVAAVGDIAGIGRREPLDELRASPLTGASFVEFFGLAERQDAAIETMRDALALEEAGGATDRRGVRFGLQPHALYSAGARVFAEASRLARSSGAALSTHLAESIEEREFVAHSTGPMRSFLERLGPWSDACAVAPGESLSPVAAFSRVAGDGRWLLAHLNDTSDEDIATLAHLGASVAFCARGHRYFGHLRTLGEHRLRDMLRAGVNACVSTDSVINLPDESADRISPLDDARALVNSGMFREDIADDLALLLRTITVNPARALSLREDLFSLAPGPVMGVIGVEVGEGAARAGALRAAFTSAARPTMLALSDKSALQADGALFA